jgi:hypothetical protein
MVEEDTAEDLLFALVAGELFVNLLAALVLVLHALHGPPRSTWAPIWAVFVASALGLLLTAAVADVRRWSRGRSGRRYS